MLPVFLTRDAGGRALCRPRQVARDRNSSSHKERAGEGNWMLKEEGARAQVPPFPSDL